MTNATTHRQYNPGRSPLLGLAAIVATAATLGAAVLLPAQYEPYAPIAAAQPVAAPAPTQVVTLAAGRGGRDACDQRGPQRPVERARGVPQERLKRRTPRQMVCPRFTENTSTGAALPLISTRPSGSMATRSGSDLRVGAVDQDRAARDLGVRLQPRREVDGIADARVGRALAGAGVARHHFARRDADADPDFRLALAGALLR